MEHLIFEIGLAVLLMALATYVASKFKLSAVPLLIIIGLVVGPHMPHFGLLDLRFIESKPIIDFMGRPRGVVPALLPGLGVLPGAVAESWLLHHHIRNHLHRHQPHPGSALWLGAGMAS